MRKASIIGSLSLALPFALAESPPGLVIPFEQMPSWFFASLGILAILGILAFAFWIWMLVDCIQKEKKHQLVWILLLIFTGTLGAALYYFLAKRKR